MKIYEGKSALHFRTIYWCLFKGSATLKARDHTRLFATGKRLLRPSLLNVSLVSTATTADEIAHYELKYYPLSNLLALVMPDRSNEENNWDYDLSQVDYKDYFILSLLKEHRFRSKRG